MEMNFTRIAYTATLLIVGLGIGENGYCQTYQFSMPISGAITVGVTDLGGWTSTTCTNVIVVNPSSPTVLNFCGILLNFQTLTETLYLDPVGLTLRQVGFISVNPSASQFLIHEYNASSPTKTADITIKYSSLPSGFSFDTGVQPLTYDAIHDVYICDGSVTPNPVAIQGSYSIVTSNQIQSGTINYSLSRYPSTYADIFTTFNTVSAADYPSLLLLSGAGQPDPYTPPGFIASPQLITDFTATNGFHALLYAGGVNWYGNKAEEGVWTVGPVGATNEGIVVPPIILTAQPQSVLVHAHDSASFTVAASGAPPLNYQWSLNGTNISGATASSLTISNVVPANLGAYGVLVTNAFGTITSSNAMLSMYPFLASPFGGVVIDWGQNATLSVQAWGSGPLSYQWYDNGVAILNATNQTLTLTSIQFTNAGLYSVVVSSPLGSVTNTPEQVVVNLAGVSLGMYPGVTVSGTVGYTYAIQATADLSKTNSWTTVATMTLTQPVQLWVDINCNASSPTNAHGFYRVMPGE
jgi:hypothetical protein